MTAVTVGSEPVRQPELRALLEQAWAYSGALYPAESNHHIDEAGLDQPEVGFFVARRGRRALGCGAIVDEQNGTGELKSLFVDPSARGLKIGRLILKAIEAHASHSMIKIIRLETGIRQPEAIHLYESAGYARRGPFGHYTDDPLSIFMEKTLG
jgi:putative acetyltransferase